MARTTRTAALPKVTSAITSFRLIASPPCPTGLSRVLDNLPPSLFPPVSRERYREVVTATCAAQLRGATRRRHASIDAMKSSIVCNERACLAARAAVNPVRNARLELRPTELQEDRRCHDALVEVSSHS